MHSSSRIHRSIARTCWLAWVDCGRLFGQHRQLLQQFAWREVQARYRGSWLGLAWSLLNPLMMLALYTFVFSVVFQARWNKPDQEGLLEFALPLFAGLIAFNLFAETVTAAPALILANASYVKRVVFPLEVLPLARFLACLVQAACSLTILLVAVAVDRGLMWSWALAPLVFLPVALLSVGAALFLSSLGVFIRDIGNLVGMTVSMLLFLSPVFYPTTRLPEAMQPYLRWNALAPMIENVRRVTIDGLPPDWHSWLISVSVGMLTSMLGYLWFYKSKNAFADVL